MADGTVQNIPRRDKCFFCLRDRLTTLVSFPGMAANKIGRKYTNRLFVICDECRQRPIDDLSNIVAEFIVNMDRRLASEAASSN